VEALQIIGWLAVRVSMGYVYLFAFYKNTQNTAARQWLVEHTAYMFPSVPEPRRTQWARWFAVIGAASMLLGGLMVLLGIEGRIGALLLLGFTAGGIYQHRRECEVATALGEKLAGEIPEQAKRDAGVLQWSGYSGNYSSGLKNWELCGVCIAVVCWGTGPLAGPVRITISDWVIPTLLSLK
jgi:uncharacterized membrane protein YphA (DoxX/SURF4 family)